MKAGDRAVVRASPRSKTVQGGEDIEILEVRYTEVTAQVLNLPKGRIGQRRILREDIVFPKQLRLL